MLARFDITTPVAAPPESSISNQPNHHAVYDNTEYPTNSLESVLKGSPWQVEAVYRAIMGIADVPRELDINVPKSYQAYEKIEGVELLAQSGLTSSNDSKEKVMTQEGRAVLGSYLKLNEFDYFIAKSNIGRRGLFVIARVDRLTTNKESASMLEYKVVEEVSPQSPMYLNLEAKVSHTLVFDKQRLLRGQPPMLQKATMAAVRNLSATFKALASYYWRSFYRPEKGSLFIPGQVGYMYDPFLTQFFNKVVSTADVPEKQHLVLLSENNDPVYNIDCIWRLLEKRGTENLPFNRVKMAMISPLAFNHVALSRSAFFANADLIMIPYQYDQSAHITPQKPIWQIHNSPGMSIEPYQYPKAQIERFDPAPTQNAHGCHVNPSDYMTEIGGVPFCAYNNVLSGDNYIFGDSFYEGRGSSVFEIVMLDYIARENISMTQLSYLIDVFPKIGRLEQFYFGPMLLVAIKEVLRGAYQ